MGAGELADAADPARVAASNVVFAGRVWDIVSEDVEFGASRFTREFMRHPGAVAILAIDEEERILLINQYRHPIRTRDWELPAGLLDLAGEAPLAAAQRELAEEADLVAARWEPLAELHPSPGGSDELIRVFEARELAASPHAHVRADEEAEIVLRWVALDEAVEGVLAGRLRNAVLMIAVLAAHARRR